MVDTRRSRRLRANAAAAEAEAVVYPMAPLFDQEAKALTPQCVRALKRIFIMCDQDHDGVLNGVEFNYFQLKYLNASFELPEGFKSNGLTLAGFLFLYESFVGKGHIETAWMTLKKAGYDNNLKLRDDLIAPPIQRAPDQTLEMTNEVFDFLSEKFHMFDTNKDGVLLPDELDDLFSTAPENPWSSDVYKDCAETDSLGGLSLDGFICKWTLMTLIDPSSAFANLVYLGYQGDFGSAFAVTSKHQVLRNKQLTRRNVFHCYVFGARGSGKTSILQSFIGRHLVDALLSSSQIFASNTIDHPDGGRKFLVLQEIREDDAITLLKNRESLAPCDVALFVYDSSNHNSWQGARDLLEQVDAYGEDVGYKVPCLIVGAKKDLGQCSLALQESAMVSEEIGIEMPIYISVRSRDLNNIFSKIIQVAEQQHLTTNKSVIWNEDSEAMFCRCYLDLLSTHQGFKMLGREDKFKMIAQRMSKTSRVYTHQQLISKYKRLTSLYAAYLDREVEKTSDWWKKKEKHDAAFRKIRNQETLPIFELLRKILEAEGSKVEDKSKSEKIEVKTKECQEGKKAQQDISMELEKCWSRIDSLENRNAILENRNATLENLNATLNSNIEDLKQKLAEVVKKCKDQHNELIDLKGKIRVFCRCRPFSDVEIAENLSSSVTSIDDEQIVVQDRTSTNKVFKFDSVFGPEVGQEEVFDTIKSFTTSVLDGFNVCIFAYGQTGTGKTFTMEGNESDRGVNFRTLKELFRIVKERESVYRYEISLSVLEVYNEQIIDLLQVDASRKRLEVREIDGATKIPGLVEECVTNTTEAWDVMQTGSNARVVGSTDANKYSSRSHCMYRVAIGSENKLNGERVQSNLWLIDLAGSERQDKTGAQGERLKESNFINKSLSTLSDVVHALARNSSHIPYRNSKLTHLLRDSLSGHSKTLLFVHVSPSVNDVGETICSLNFASRVRGIELGPVIQRAQKQKENAQLKKKKEKVLQSKVGEYHSSPSCSTPLTVVSSDKASQISSIRRRSLNKIVVRRPTVTVRTVNRTTIARRGGQLPVNGTTEQSRNSTFRHNIWSTVGVKRGNL